MSENLSTRQVATRISDDDFRVLQVGLVVEDASTMQDLLRPVIERFARELEREPEVAKILRESQAYRDRKSGVRRIAEGVRPSKSDTKRRDSN
jgi:hypothetical protein